MYGEIGQDFISDLLTNFSSPCTHCWWGGLPGGDTISYSNNPMSKMSWWPFPRSSQSPSTNGDEEKDSVALDKDQILNLQKFGTFDQYSTTDDNVGSSRSRPTTKTISINDAIQPLIKQFVSMTNTTLATLEKSADETSTAFISRFRPLLIQGEYIVTRSLATYEQRGQYGVPIVAGSAILFGGLVALRTGKYRGAMAASVAGGAAYGNIYGYQLS